ATGVCCTRALKNAKHLQKLAPEIFARHSTAEGFGTGVPLKILTSLHRIRHDSPVLNPYPDVAKLLFNRQLPIPERAVRSPLFNGTLHFAQITFATNGGFGPIVAITTPDMNQIVEYAQHAVVPISEYAGLYGKNSVSVSPTLLTRTIILTGTSFTQGDLE